MVKLHILQHQKGNVRSKFLNKIEGSPTEIEVRIKILIFVLLLTGKFQLHVPNDL